jgi:hypothetical protein
MTDNIKSKTKNNYYDERLMRDYCKQWQDSTTELQKQKIYNKMQIILALMYNYIRIRYFTIPYHDVEAVKVSALSKCFLAINTYDFKHTTFSFFQTIIKNELHNYNYYNIYTIRARSSYLQDLDLCGIDQDSNSDLIDNNESYSDLIDNNESYSDYKSDLILALKYKLYENRNDRDIIRDIIYFLENYEMRFMADLEVFLFKKQFNTFAHIKQTIRIDKNKDSNKNINYTADNEYYNDSVHRK